MAAQALIIMLKNPVVGQVKTRLAKEIGDDRALAVYKELLQHVANITSSLSVDVFLFYSDVIERNDIFDNNKYKKYVQSSGDLGVRMDYAFSIPFKNEYNEVVMIGADCYAMDTNHIHEAFNHLRSNDFVIGPATDGGYYLIGMKKWNRWILEHKSWSTAQLFSETINDIQSRNGSVWIGPQLSDVDHLEDISDYPDLMALAKTI